MLAAATSDRDRTCSPFACTPSIDIEPLASRCVDRSSRQAPHRTQRDSGSGPAYISGMGLCCSLLSVAFQR